MAKATSFAEMKKSVSFDPVVVFTSMYFRRPSGKKEATSKPAPSPSMTAVCITCSASSGRPTAMSARRSRSRTSSSPANPRARSSRSDRRPRLLVRKLRVLSPRAVCCCGGGSSTSSPEILDYDPGDLHSYSSFCDAYCACVLSFILLLYYAAARPCTSCRI